MDMAEQIGNRKSTSGRGLVTGACQAGDSFTWGSWKTVFTSVQLESVVQTPPLTLEPYIELTKMKDSASCSKAGFLFPHRRELDVLPEGLETLSKELLLPAG